MIFSLMLKDVSHLALGSEDFSSTVLAAGKNKAARRSTNPFSDDFVGPPGPNEANRRSFKK